MNVLLTWIFEQSVTSLESTSKSRADESSGILSSVLLPIESLGSLLGPIGLSEGISMLLQLGVFVLDSLVLLFMVDKLAEQQVSVIFLTIELYLELLVLKL